MKNKHGIKCTCCNRYYEDCRNGVRGDALTEMLYCAHNYVGAFEHCEDCNLVNYGRDCKNNIIPTEEIEPC